MTAVFNVSISWYLGETFTAELSCILDEAGGVSTGILKKVQILPGGDEARHSMLVEGGSLGPCQLACQLACRRRLSTEEPVITRWSWSSCGAGFYQTISDRRHEIRATGHVFVCIYVSYQTLRLITRRHGPRF